MNRTFMALGGGLAFIGVALGAFGAHALRERISRESLQIWQTGVQYQLFHALALILIGILATEHAPKLLKRAGWLIYFGVLIFSGSLYVLALTGIRLIGAITPFGGVCFLAGWAIFTWCFARRETTQ